MKTFKCGLIVGKFSPLHLGHEYLIQRAQEACDTVVILSYSQPEFPGCSALRREMWLKERFPAARVLVITGATLAQWPQIFARWARVPANDAPAEVHRQFCAVLCSAVLEVRVDAVYSSENYGEGFAQHLSAHYRSIFPDYPAVASVLVDLNRERFPISGSALRQSPELARQWVSPEVRASFVQRICFLGGESSGKTTLARALAKRFQAELVEEFGRERWEQKAGKLGFEDLLFIAEEQVRREDERAQRTSTFVFCDTSPLTTLFYSLDFFGRADEALVTLSDRRYDLTILCAPDFEFQQDGTRRDAAFRERQHAWYLQTLAQRGVAFLVVGGSVEERVNLVTERLRETN